MDGRTLLARSPLTKGRQCWWKRMGRERLQGAERAPTSFVRWNRPGFAAQVYLSRFGMSPFTEFRNLDILILFRGLGTEGRLTPSRRKRKDRQYASEWIDLL